MLSACQPTAAPGLTLSHTPGQVELFAPGTVSTELYERDLAVNETGDEILFTLGNYTQTLRCLVAIRLTDGAWSDPEVLPFSGRYNDIEPFYAPGGKRLFFASTRPMDSLAAPDRRDYNIWVVEKKGLSWGSPQPLDTVINTRGDEFYPAVSANGNLYFTASRPSGPGREDIFLSRFLDRRYQAPVPLDTTVNSATYEFNAYVSPDERLLVFSSYGRADDLGGGDLYYSIKNDSGNWDPAKHLGPEINSTRLDFCPFLDIQRGNFYFTSDRVRDPDRPVRSIAAFREAANRIENGMGNIYRVGLQQLPWHIEPQNTPSSQP